MRLSLNILARYIALPSGDTASLEVLFEDLGLEIKRLEKTSDDVVFSLELLANRGDLRSYTGIAQELHGRTGWPLQFSRIPDVIISDAGGMNFSVESDVCLQYTLSTFELTQHHQTTPDEVTSLLAVDGTMLNCVPVDVGNFVGVEMGQPMHVFDLDKIQGTLRVRESLEGEQAHLLFQEAPQQLPAGTLVIADSVNILAVAGVIGCEPAKVTNASSRVVLESALFDPVAIRKTSKRLGVQTTASLRFERGGDAGRVVRGAQRVASLLEQSGWRYIGTSSSELKLEQAQPMSLSVTGLNRFLGSTLSQEIVSKALQGFGFNVNPVSDDVLQVVVPSHRVWDILESCDLYEEVCRAISYSHLPKQFPQLRLSDVLDDVTDIDRRVRLENVLVENGFYEVFTEGYYSEEHVRKLKTLSQYAESPHLRVLGGKDSAAALMKNNNVAHALDLAKVSEDNRFVNYKAFEWSRTFHPSQAEAAQNDVVERKSLWLVAGGESYSKTMREVARSVDPLYIKGLVTRLLTVLGVPFEFQQTTSSDADDYPVTSALLHPGRKANIVVNGAVVGVFGEIHPRLVDAFSIKRSAPCFMELNESVFEHAPVRQVYVAPKRLQTQHRDLCFFVPRGVPSQEVTELIRSESSLISDVAVIDVYPIATGEVGSAVTFRVSFEPELTGESSLSSDLLAQQLTLISQQVTSVLGPKGIYQR